ncbi:hypothetical protein HAX54_039169 [Datura stramonium]|uniref:Uncharacterized protein n=1 Tax=Datura stramonium TaxID=4076 RepID=A0ABS8SJ07_DATST|nr:hypothetical protein [Datura stramonium]
MKSTSGETSDEESEGEDIENGNFALMARSYSNSDALHESKDEHEIGIAESSTGKVSAPALTNGTVMETDSLNVPLETGQELKNSRETNPETMIQLGTYLRAARDKVSELYPTSTMSNPSPSSTSLHVPSAPPPSSPDKTSPVPEEKPILGSPNSSIVTALMSPSPRSPSIDIPNSTSTLQIDLPSLIADIRS